MINVFNIFLIELYIYGFKLIVYRSMYPICLRITVYLWFYVDKHPLDLHITVYIYIILVDYVDKCIHFVCIELYMYDFGLVLYRSMYPTCLNRTVYIHNYIYMILSWFYID